MENLYDTDFYRWTQQQTELLKACRPETLDTLWFTNCARWRKPANRSCKSVLRCC